MKQLLLLFFSCWIAILALSSQSSASPPAYFDDAKNRLLTYKTPFGQTSALLSTPKENNGQLVLYLHPTTGIDDWCAPLNAPSSTIFQDDGMREQLEELLGEGYSILQPNYEGLGSPGEHPFFNLDKNIPAISLALERAFDLDRDLSGKYLVLGYSQGASLALEVAHLSAELPGTLQGSVAIAPPSQLALQVKASSYLEGASPGSAFLIYLLRAYGYEDLLSAKAKAAIRESRGMCVFEFSALMIRENLIPSAALRPGSWREGRRLEFLRDLQKAEIGTPPAGRVLLVGGNYDRVVFPALINNLSLKIKESGSSLVYRKFNAGHLSLPFRSWKTVQPWIKESFRSRSARFYLPIAKSSQSKDRNKI